MSFSENPEKQIIVEVAIDNPINKLFDYRWNDLKLDIKPQRGQVIAVNFGRKDCVGVVMSIKERSDHD
ncbi:MAG: hypothetical protein ACKOAB_10520, partial [Polynucleobacter victoriensis]